MHVPTEQISDIRYHIRHRIENHMRINLKFGNSPLHIWKVWLHFPVTLQTKTGPGRLIVEVSIYLTHIHTNTHTHTHNLLDHSERAIRPSQWPLPIHSTIWRIRNRDPYNRAVTDLIPRRHRHWQWHLIMCFSIFKYQESLNEGF